MASSKINAMNQKFSVKNYTAELEENSAVSPFSTYAQIDISGDSNLGTPVSIMVYGTRSVNPVVAKLTYGRTIIYLYGRLTDTVYVTVVYAK